LNPDYLANANEPVSAIGGLEDEDADAERPNFPIDPACTPIVARELRGFCTRVSLGYGLGYRILYPRETRTRGTGMQICGGLMAGKLAQI